MKKHLAKYRDDKKHIVQPSLNPQRQQGTERSITSLFRMYINGILLKKGREWN